MKKLLRSIIVVAMIVLVIFLVKFSLDSSTAGKEAVARMLTSRSITDLPIALPEITEEGFKIVLDPGHGGEDPGAEGASGSYEKDFNLSLATKIKNELADEANVFVYMTREDDIFLSSETRDRTNIANELQADLFLSIHANTFADPTVSGTETFYYDESSKAWADIIHRQVAAATGFRDRGVRQENFFVLTDTNMPAALVEVGYITNPQEEQTMLTESFQQSVAESIADGIREYLASDAELRP